MSDQLDRPCSGNETNLNEGLEASLELNLPGGPPNIYDDDFSAEVMHQRVDLGRGMGPILIGHAAEQAGADVTWLGAEYAVAQFGNTRLPIVGHGCTESAVAAGIVIDKQLTKEVLEEAGVPVPPGRRVSSASDAVAAQRELGVSVVVKPRFGLMGRGITVDITDPSEVRTAYSRARAFGRSILVEAFIKGQEYRCHATSDECVSVFRRLLPNVRGDGESTIAELIESKNHTRRLNPTTHGQLIPLDDVALEYLARRGLSPNTVVEHGKTVIVRDVNGITSGGDSEECLQSSSLQLRSVASAAVAAVPGMDWGGVDILVDDLTGDAWVMEVNTNASINGPTFPVFGAPRDVATQIWNRIAAAGSPDSDEPPPPQRLNQEPLSLEEVCRPRGHNEGHLELMELLEYGLRTHGYRVRKRGRRVITAQKSDDVHWMADGFNSRDPNTAQRFLKARIPWQRALASRDVPVAPASRVHDLADLKSFMAEHPSSSVHLHAPGRQGRYAVPRILEPHTTPSSESLRGRSSWLAQISPSGRRAQVIADRNGIAATIVPAEQSSLTQAELSVLTDAAVAAVRAVAGLRWACVAIVMPARNGSDHELSAIMVEDMTYRPVFRGNDAFASGSLSELVRLIADWIP